MARRLLNYSITITRFQNRWLNWRLLLTASICVVIRFNYLEEKKKRRAIRLLCWKKIFHGFSFSILTTRHELSRLILEIIKDHRIGAQSTIL